MALELPKFGKKDGKGSSGKPKVDVTMKIMEFFDKNPVMKIVVPVVLLVVLVGVIGFVVLGDGVLLDDSNLGSDSVASTDYVGIYDGGNDPIEDPEIVELIKKDPLSEDILATAVYKGYVVGSSGLKTATVQIGADGSQTLTLSLGEKIGDSEWVVTEINPEYVLVEAGEVERKLELK